MLPVRKDITEDRIRLFKGLECNPPVHVRQQQNIGKVDIQSNQIVFTDKEEKQIYKTGLMNDPGLTQRLYDAGAQFSSEIVEQGSPVLSFLIWYSLLHGGYYRRCC